MWIVKDKIVILDKSDDIKVNNAIIIETDTQYFIIGINNTPKRQSLHESGHPLAKLRGLTYSLDKDNKKYKVYFVLDGNKVEDEKALCYLCSQKFKGFTGTCAYLRNENTDEVCIPDISIGKDVLMTTGLELPLKHTNKRYSPYGKCGFYIEDTDFTMITIMRSEALFQVKEGKYKYHDANDAKLSEPIDTYKIAVTLLNNGKQSNTTWHIGFPLKNTNVILFDKKGNIKEEAYSKVNFPVDVRLDDYEKKLLLNDYIAFMNHVKFNGKEYKFAKVGTLIGLSYNNEWYYSRALLVAEIKIKDSVVKILFKDIQHINDIANLTNHEEPDIL